MLSSPVWLFVLKVLFACLAAIVSFRLGAGRPVVRTPDGLRGLGGALAGAALGAKLGFVLQFPALLLPVERDTLLATQTGWMLVSGLSGPGAVTGGLIGLTWAARARAGELKEALLPPLLIALMMLDAGALRWSLTEPGFGVPTARWGMDFGDGVLRHPVMLYDAAALALLLWAERATRALASPSGARANVLLAGCFGVWLLLGFLKPPFGPILMLEAIYPHPAVYRPGLTGEQWLCLMTLLWLLGGAWRAWRHRAAARKLVSPDTP